MESMLQSRYLSVLGVKTRDALQTEFVRFTKQLGFETVSAVAVIDHVLRESDGSQDCIGTGPDPWHCGTNRSPPYLERSAKARLREQTSGS